MLKIKGLIKRKERYKPFKEIMTDRQTDMGAHKEVTVNIVGCMKVMSVMLHIKCQLKLNADPRRDFFQIKSVGIEFLVLV